VKKHYKDKTSCPKRSLRKLQINLIVTLYIVPRIRKGLIIIITRDNGKAQQSASRSLSLQRRERGGEASLPEALAPRERERERGREEDYYYYSRGGPPRPPPARTAGARVPYAATTAMCRPRKTAAHRIRRRPSTSRLVEAYRGPEAPLSRSRDDGAREKARLTRCVTEHEAPISRRLPLRRSNGSVFLSLSLLRALTYSFDTHHRIRRTAVRRVSAHIPDGEAERATRGEKRPTVFSAGGDAAINVWATSLDVRRRDDRSGQTRLDFTRGHRKWRCAVARSNNSSGSRSSNGAYNTLARSLARSLAR